MTSKNQSAKEILKFGLGGGILEVAYCSLIAWLINSLDHVFNGPPTPFNIIFVLLLLVFSVAISGVLIFGYPLYLAIQQKYQPAIVTVVTSLLTLILGGVLIFNILIFNSHNL